MAVSSSLTLVNVPRRMAWRVMIGEEDLDHVQPAPEVGVKCSVTRGFFASHAVT